MPAYLRQQDGVVCSKAKPRISVAALLSNRLSTPQLYTGGVCYVRRGIPSRSEPMALWIARYRRYHPGNVGRAGCTRLKAAVTNGDIGSPINGAFLFPIDTVCPNCGKPCQQTKNHFRAALGQSIQVIDEGERPSFRVWSMSARAWGEARLRNPQILQRKRFR